VSIFVVEIFAWRRKTTAWDEKGLNRLGVGKIVLDFSIISWGDLSERRVKNSNWKKKKKKQKKNGSGGTAKREDRENEIFHLLRLWSLSRAKHTVVHNARNQTSPELTVAKSAAAYFSAAGFNRQEVVASDLALVF